ncbi:hypothetical protein CBM2626_B130135 [Cupriavidus taiwanensis]|nr:hypothetical protein CBM2626_B130135 [Cupriavidus taiwanensis]
MKTPWGRRGWGRFHRTALVRFGILYSSVAPRQVIFRRDLRGFRFGAMWLGAAHLQELTGHRGLFDGASVAPEVAYGHVNK